MNATASACVLLALLLLAPAAPAAAPGLVPPADHFEGIGFIEGTYDCLDLVFTLTVHKVEGTWYATFTMWPCAMAIVPWTTLGTVYKLQGDWETGLWGYAPLGRYWGFLSIEPYGDGQDIRAWGCMMCPTDDFYWWGRVSDLRLTG